jgi:CBS domain-containing protein
MLIRDVCNREVVCADRTTSVRIAAEMMRRHHVGDVVVVDRADPERMPMGIVTDRDIAIEVVARGLDPEATMLGDLVAWGSLVCVQETDSYAATIELMHAKGIRRMPVINSAGVLVGIVTVDDMLPRLARELSDVAELVDLGRRREMQTRP